MLLKTLLGKPPAPAVLACDVLVVGGGSGGLACAQAASRLGQSVVLCDYVRPSDNTGTVWGLGGTCVNVGCVPKKLFHRAGYFGQCLRDGELAAFGFEQPAGGAKADWTALRTMVQNHVKMLNFTYRSSLPPNCQYVNSSVQFHGNGGGVWINNNSTKVQASKAIVIAVGGRPILPPIPGAELGISSDDVFSLEQSPGRTLVVGSSYIGLETASFLHGIGLDTTLLVRSRPLRGIPGFDSDCADKLLSQMADRRLYVKRGTELVGLASTGTGIRAAFADGSVEPDYDTVLFATGRFPEVSGRLGELPSSITVSPRSGKIQVDPSTFVACGADAERPVVYAIGDCAETGSPELTPVAIRQGELVARHVANLPSSSKQWDSLHVVPSTVFSLPSEYSRTGMSEQEAVHQFGADDVEVYQREWEPLETGAAHVSSSDVGRAYCKLVTVKSQNQRVVGLHLITPTSSEAIHGLALSLALGATKDDFDSRVLGIHPTDGEALLDMTVTKASQLDYKVASGCGGGKCG